MKQQVSTVGWLLVPEIQPNIAAMNEIGKNIKSRIKELGRTQSWLAEAVGVSNNAVSKWVKLGEIGRENIAAVAAALDTTVDQLLGMAYPDDAARESDEISRRIERLSPAQREAVLAVVYSYEGSESPPVTQSKTVDSDNARNDADERRILKLFRQVDKRGKAEILKSARAYAENFRAQFAASAPNPDSARRKRRENQKTHALGENVKPMTGKHRGAP